MKIAKADGSYLNRPYSGPIIPGQNRPFSDTGMDFVNGFRFGNLVYLTDAKAIPDASMDAMRGADTLVINALRERPHPVHLSLAESLEVIAEIRPQRAFLVHLSHELSHADASALLPPGVEVAYDGLTLDGV